MILDILGDVLPIILYLLGSILLIVLIILGIKLIVTMNKIENVVDDINVKVSKLNGFFSVIDFTTDRLALFSDRIVDGITFLINKIFKKKEKKKNVKKESEENE